MDIQKSLTLSHFYQNPSVYGGRDMCPFEGHMMGHVFLSSKFFSGKTTKFSKFIWPNSAKFSKSSCFSVVDIFNMTALFLD